MLTSWSGYPIEVTCTEIAFFHDESDLSDISNASILNDYSLSDHSTRSSHALIRTVRYVPSDTYHPNWTVRNGRFRNPSPPLSTLYLFLPLYLMHCHENHLAKAS